MASSSAYHNQLSSVALPLACKEKPLESRMAMDSLDKMAADSCCTISFGNPNLPGRQQSSKRR